MVSLRVLDVVAVTQQKGKEADLQVMAAVSFKGRCHLNEDGNSESTPPSFFPSALVYN